MFFLPVLHIKRVEVFLPVLGKLLSCCHMKCASVELSEYSLGVASLSWLQTLIHHGTTQWVLLSASEARLQLGESCRAGGLWVCCFLLFSSGSSVPYVEGTKTGRPDPEQCFPEHTQLTVSCFSWVTHSTGVNRKQRGGLSSPMPLRFSLPLVLAFASRVEPQEAVWWCCLA